MRGLEVPPGGPKCEGQIQALGIPTPSKSRPPHGAPPKCRASRFQQPLFLHGARSAVLRGPPTGEGAGHVSQ
jgi:hypothetical protein